MAVTGDITLNNKLTVTAGGLAVTGGTTLSNTNTATNSLTVNSGELGENYGNKSLISSYYTHVGNYSYINTYAYRFASGSDWYTASTRIQSNIDTNANFAMIEFNPQNYPEGIGITNASGEGIKINNAGVTTFTKDACISSGNLAVGSTNPGTGYKLYVNGSTYLAGATDINGNTNIQNGYNLTVSSGNLGVGSTTTNNYRLYVNGTTYFNGSFTVLGSSFMNSLLTVTSTLIVGSSNASSNYVLDVSGNACVSNLLTLKNGLAVTNNTTVSGNLTVGSATANNNNDNLYVTGTTYLNSTLYVGSSTTLNNGLTVNSSLSTLSGGLTVNNGATTLNAGLSVTGDTYLKNSIYMSNDCYIWGKNNVGVYEPCFLAQSTGNATYLRFGSGGFNICNTNWTNAIYINNNNNITMYGATTLNNGLFVNINSNTSTIATFDNDNNINFYGDFYATTKNTYLGTTYLSGHSTFNNECWIYGKNQNTTPEPCFLPRNVTNGTYLNYGTGGFYIRTNDSTNAIIIDNSKNTTVNGDLYAKSKLYIGVNEPGGGSGDNAYLEYVAVSGEQTVLRIVVKNDYNDNINLTPSGNVGINTDNPVYKLDVNGTLGVNGDATFNYSCKAVSFNATSDYRIKENVLNLNDSLDKSSFTVDHLRPVTYTNKLSGKQDIGLIAHELQEHYPFLVSGEKDGSENQSVNYIGLIGILIKEIQELKERVKTLESTQPFITK